MKTKKTKKKAVKKIKKIKSKPKSKKVSKKTAAPALQKSLGKSVGKVTHFFGGIRVAIVKFKKPVKVGTRLYFRGATTDFVQVLDSMQFDHQPITVAKPNKQVGIKVGKRVREGDGVFLKKS